MPRKTIEVDALLKMANSQLAAKDSTADGREAVCAFIEGVLLSVDRYAGFRYLDTAEVAGAGTRREYFIKSV
jgi:hypothetical protein